MKPTIPYKEEMERARQAQRRGILLCIVIIIGVMLLPRLSLFQSEADTALRFEADGFLLTLPGETEHISIPYSEIEYIAFLEAPEYGVCISGGTENGCKYGTWESEPYGSYLLCVNLDFPQAILVQTKTQTVLFNFESADTTRQLYTSIESAIS